MMYKRIWIIYLVILMLYFNVYFTRLCSEHHCFDLNTNVMRKLIDYYTNNKTVNIIALPQLASD